MAPNRNLLVTIDIGNSAVTYGIHRGKVVLRSGFVSGNSIPVLARILSSSGVLNSRNKVIISSVVPDLTRKLKKLVRRWMGAGSVYIVGKNVYPRLSMRYKRKALGSDRLVNIYGALKLYEMPLLIIDFGTAITFDYVSKRGIFEGGLIVPGIETSWKALEKGAALLPSFKKVGTVHGFVRRDTKSAMRAGLLYGFGALTDGLIRRFERKYGSKMKVLATGGFAARIEPYTMGFDRVDPLHTVKSLALMYRNEIEGGVK
ncbi:MAG: type III pantothenate kinase [Candidatus Omnitrophica bacterium]|nr:type III pantothenate kinase [Candidatus Omnitrophota bacterium]